MKRSSSLLTATAIAGLLLISTTSPLYALDNHTTPAGESVVHGNAVFDRPSSGQLNVTQLSDRAIINWDSFDIGSQAKTTFRQPDRSSLAVNRVVGGNADPTRILGKLSANGKIMVLDRNGVFFGKDAAIDVGSIIASTGNIDDDAIMSGAQQIVLSDFGDAPIENHGSITVEGAGLAALVSPVVRNAGIITAKMGRVELAAGGEQATVDLYGDNLIQLALEGNAGQVLVDNPGRVAAEGGVIAMTTGFAEGVLDSVINMSGVADVSSARRDGGRIVLSGGDVNIAPEGQATARSSRRRGGDVVINAREDVNIDGLISTSGAAGAGDIDINGGGGNRSVIGQSAVIEANSERGRGGFIEMGADGGFLDMNGQITSSGRSGGGDINIENGDNPVTIGSSARILSEARHSGAGGDISISSGEGDQVIGGQVRTIGDRGGNIRVSSRSGIDILDNGVLETRSTQYRGRNIRLFVGEGDLNNEGIVLSSGRTGGGMIALNSTNVITSADSLISSISTGTGRGGSIDVQTTTVNADGEWNVSGEKGGGNIIVNSFSDIDIEGNLRANAIQTGNGGRVELDSESGTVTHAGSISARGGTQSGNGGAVIFSQPNVIETGASVDVSAPNGQEGTFSH
jgi:filamentous hemagglutinin family protein